MNDLIRPTLYESYHFIWPVKPDAKNLIAERDSDVMPADGETVDVVGPICESGDYLAKDRPLPRTERGRSDCGIHGRRIWICDEQQLQQPPARRRCWWMGRSSR